MEAAKKFDELFPNFSEVLWSQKITTNGETAEVPVFKYRQKDPRMGATDHAVTKKFTSLLSNDPQRLHKILASEQKVKFFSLLKI